MAAKKTNYPWQDKISNHAQIGGIETSVLNDGPGRGARIAWVNTGTGFRYKVVIDKGLNIADAFFNQHNLVWLSHPGITAPRPDTGHGIEWLYSFDGGLLVTCGLAHFGGPESGETEERGLHGRISNIPASIESIVQPDPAMGKLDMSITGLVKESRAFGPSLEMRRTISSRIGEATVKIRDVITNRANTPSPLMILYHCNFGWPLVDEGTDLVWKGKCESFGRDIDDAIFNGKGDFMKCKKPLESHRGFGESCAVIDVKADRKGFCSIGLANRKLGLGVVMKYKKNQLPALTNWQHWGPGEYVTGIEPGTNSPIGQNKAREQKELINLAPGKSKTFELEMTILTDKKEISKFAQAK